MGYKAAVTQLKEKEKKSASLVQQLTAMVKEQKSRISQLNKAKNDAVANLKVLKILQFFSPARIHYIKCLSSLKIKIVHSPGWL